MKNNLRSFILKGGSNLKIIHKQFPDNYLFLFFYGFDLKGFSKRKLMHEFFTNKKGYSVLISFLPRDE